MRRCLLLLALIAVALPAHAHPIIQNAMWVVFAPDRVRVAVNVSLKEIFVAQHLSAESVDQIAPAALEAAAQRHGDYVRTHLTLAVQSISLPAHVEKVTPPVLFAAEPEQTFFQYEISYAFPAGEPPTAVTFRHEMLREWSPAAGQVWDVSYALRLKRSDQPEVSSGLLRALEAQEFPTGWSTASSSAAAKPAAASTPFTAYLRHGVMHILTGWDHLLFVTALVLATATFWEMFKVIAAFTLAHTITLALSVLTGFRLPDAIVEPTIAGSIIFVALENVLWPRRTHGWLRFGIAFGFGLVHGLGFAGGLRDAMGELGTSAILVALLAFSLGVEIGHQIVVLPTFAVLQIGARKLSESFRTNVLRYGSIAISLAGGYYFVHALRA